MDLGSKDTARKSTGDYKTKHVAILNGIMEYTDFFKFRLESGCGQQHAQELMENFRTGIAASVGFDVSGIVGSGSAGSDFVSPMEPGSFMAPPMKKMRYTQQERQAKPDDVPEIQQLFGVVGIDVEQLLTQLPAGDVKDFADATSKTRHLERLAEIVVNNHPLYKAVKIHLENLNKRLGAAHAHLSEVVGDTLTTRYSRLEDWRVIVRTFAERM